MCNQPTAKPLCQTQGQQQQQQQQGQHVQMSLSEDIFEGSVCDRVSEGLAEALRNEGAPSS